jgi:hypothetical protein
MSEVLEAFCSDTWRIRLVTYYFFRVN